MENRESTQGRESWRRRFSTLAEKLDDWDRYREVFDPISDTEIIYGSLADDLADIYRDLTEPLSRELTLEDRIWTWQFSFRTHWGHHAVDALRTIHTLLHYH